MKMAGKYYLTNKEMLQRKSTYNDQNVLEEEKTKNVSMLVIDTESLLLKMNLAKKKKNQKRQWARNLHNNLSKKTKNKKQKTVICG